MPGSPLKSPREIRFRWYLQVDKYHKSVNEVCQIFGISRKTYYKWRKKDCGHGSSAYISRKDHPNLKLTPHIRLTIYKAKTLYGYGPKKMKRYLKDNFGIKVSTTIIYRFYRKRYLIKKPQHKLPWYKPMKEPFLALKPGENVQLDVKYVPSNDELSKWNYQFRFIDTFTNMQHTVDCLDKSSKAAIYAFKEAQKHLPFKITGIQTDNGSEFRGEFAVYLKTHNIIQRFIPKRSAPWNGKVERANRSVDDEYYLNPDKPWKNLAEYVHWYNYERYHEGKGMNGLRPYEKYLEYLKSVTLEC
jgi:transposase